MGLPENHDMIQELTADRSDQPFGKSIPPRRGDLAEFLTSKGCRISHGTLSKLCSPAINEGPQCCGMFGRDCMYYPSVGLAWAKARMAMRKSGRHNGG